VMNADGSNQIQLTNSLVEDVSPTWSPDGSKIAFASKRNNNGWDIYVMNADGTAQKRLTENISQERKHNSDFTWDNSNPAWSPDGRWIAFSSTRDGDAEIYKMTPSGSNLRNMTEHVGRDWKPTWSPDARKIAFVSDRDGLSNIYSMNSAGEEQIRLTSAKGDANPSWSP